MLEQSLRHLINKVSGVLFILLQKKPFGQNNFQNPCKRAIFFRKAQDGRALLSPGLKKLSYIYVGIILVLGSYVSLASMEGKIRKGPILLDFNLVKYQCEV